MKTPHVLAVKNGLRTAAVASRLAAADITVGDVLRTSSQRVAKKLTGCKRNVIFMMTLMSGTINDGSDRRKM